MPSKQMAQPASTTNRSARLHMHTISKPPTVPMLPGAVPGPQQRDRARPSLAQAELLHVPQVILQHVLGMSTSRVSSLPHQVRRPQRRRRLSPRAHRREQVRVRVIRRLAATIRQNYRSSIRRVQAEARQ